MQISGIPHFNCLAVGGWVTCSGGWRQGAAKRRTKRGVASKPIRSVLIGDVTVDEGEGGGHQIHGIPTVGRMRTTRATNQRRPSDDVIHHVTLPV